MNLIRISKQLNMFPVASKAHEIALSGILLNYSMVPNLSRSGLIAFPFSLI